MTPRNDVEAFDQMSCRKPDGATLCCEGRDDSDDCLSRVDVGNNQTGVCYCDEHCLTVSDNFPIPDCCPDFLPVCAKQLDINVDNLIKVKDGDQEIPALRTMTRRRYKSRHTQRLRKLKKAHFRHHNSRIRTVMRAFVVDPTN